MTNIQLRNAVARIMGNNRRTTDGHRYTLPSPDIYPYQWFWDSCFHAIILSHYDPSAAEAELHALVHHQWDNGCLPHMIYWEPHESVMHVDWGVDGTSTLIQPPVLAYATWRVFTATGDHQFLEAMFPVLVRYHEYLLRDRRSKRGLIGIINPDESGEDNSPRFDHALGLPPQHHVSTNQERRFALFQKHRACHYHAARCTSEHFWVEDVPFNVFFLESLRAMEAIARELGQDHLARQCKNEQHTHATRMREHMLEDGIFRSLSGLEGTPVTVDTWSHFAPLLTGQYSQAEADQLMNTYWHDQEHFATTYRTPTVSGSDPAFNPAEPDWGKPWQHPDWRGSIWAVPNWVLYRGLLRYGYTNEAAAVRSSLLSLIEQSGFRENYHPHTGDGQGAHDFTWSGLALDMFLPRHQLVL